METDRRTFVQQLGAGAAALTMAAGATSAFGQARKSGRKMVIRVDDVGMSKVCNIGTFDAIDGGLPSSVDIMLDSPGSVDALERLRKYPWLSLGWHMHMWGTPVLPKARVPSLVEHGGQFDGRFRTDLTRAAEVNFDEAVAELRAQMELCKRVLGKVPTTRGGGDNGTTPWAKAVTQVGAEYKLIYGYASSPPTSASYQKHINDARARGEEWAMGYSATPSPAVQASPQWAGRKMYNAAGTTAFVDLLTTSIVDWEKNYDPVKFYTEDRSGILTGPADYVYIQAWHPGYLDYYAYRLGERVARARAQQFTLGRVQDVSALTDDRLRNWIKANNIELVNQRDALFGTTEFQDHLRAVKSPVALV